MAKQIRKDLTKAELIKLGITDVSPDGKNICKDGRILIQTPSVKHRKYGKTITYLVVTVYDPAYYRELRARTGCCTAMRTLLVHRIVYAWYKGIAHKDMDIDHIDDDKFNNSIDNLQEITRGENIRKRKSQANQYTVTKGTDKYDECIEVSRQAQKNKHSKAWKMDDFINYRVFRKKCLELAENEQNKAPTEEEMEEMFQDWKKNQEKGE